MEGNFWQLKTRSLYIHCPIFKMKLYRYKNEQNQQPYVMFHLPSAKKIVAYTSKLQVLAKSYKLSQQPNAFEIVSLQNEDYLVAGTRKGKIECQPIIQNPERQCFYLNDECNITQALINDIAIIDHHKIVNCFNDGSLSFWNLKTKARIHSIQNVHENYTYKIRKINQKLLTCGNDCRASLVDLYKGKKLKAFVHPAPVWCVYPINQNIFSSVGLFNKINIWDLRTDKLSQSSPLQSGQSSFVTRFNASSLIFGDSNTLKICDLRRFEVSQQMASANMLSSAQSIIVTQNGGYVCGRGFQVNHFTKVNQINFDIAGTTRIYDPHGNGSKMFMYTVPQQNQQIEEQQELLQNINVEDQQWEDEIQNFVSDDDDSNSQQNIEQQDSEDDDKLIESEQEKANFIQNQGPQQDKLQKHNQTQNQNEEFKIQRQQNDSQFSIEQEK